MDTDCTVTKPVPLRKRKTHELSQSDDEDETMKAPSPPKTPGKAKDEEPAPSGEASDEETSKPKCEYWEKCYRKDPNHMKEYRHPKRRLSARPKPSKKLDDGETVNVAGGFKLKRLGSDFKCT